MLVSLIGTGRCTMSLTPFLHSNAGEHSLYRMGLTSHAFLTLESISKDFPSLVESLQREIDRAKVNTTALPGLAEQLDLQMNILKDPTVPDTEFLVWPGLKWADSPPDPEKSYVTINMMLEHPFSRGNIVRSVSLGLISDRHTHIPLSAYIY